MRVVDPQHRVNRIRQLVLTVYIPDADPAVVAAGEEETSPLRVPIETVTLAIMAEKHHIWLDFISGRTGAMLEVVEDVHLATDRLCRYDLIHLGHVAGPVDFSLVINLQLDLNSLVLGKVCTALRSSSLSLAHCGRLGSTSVGVVKALPVLTSVL